MKKELTFDELVMCFTMMEDGDMFGDILFKLDPSIAEEELYYFQQRLDYHRRTSKEKISLPAAALLVLKEEKVYGVVAALALFGYVNYKLGIAHSDSMKQRKDDMIAQALDKLAEDLGSRAEVIKINFDKDGKVRKDE